MANEEVKLYGAWFSPFSRRVELALKMKGVEYEYIDENLSNKSPSLVKYNPVYKKVPVLLHNGNPICESMVILEYIDETWKSGIPILPQDPYERAIARFWAKFIDDKCVPALWKACLGKGNEQKNAFEEANDLLKVLENEVKGKKFFGGESIGIIDIVANFVAVWVGIFQEIKGVELLTEEKFPNIIEWSNEYLSCSIVKESLPPRAELFSKLETIFK